MALLPIVEDVQSLRQQIVLWRVQGLRIGLVPTMGALHVGHLSLIAKAKAHADKIVASIFVNPLQFGVGEDFTHYPRTLVQDAAALAQQGCDMLYAPNLHSMYPEGFATSVRVERLAQGLCSIARPGHFEGVATVVTKLLIQAQADIAVFGEKDYQQLLIIKQLARDLDLPTQIIAAPLMRDVDGLALSSRNAYLSPEQRAIARHLPNSLGQAAHALQAGEDVAEVCTRAHTFLLNAGFDSVDYFELRAADDLTPLQNLNRPARLLAAARLGSTRLLDNLAL
jgi:pantoate--beta-alanine ligase